MKNKKNVRWHLRTTQETDEQATTLAKELGISKNALIEKAVNDLILNKEKKCICCPTCNAAIMFKQEQMPENRIDKIECSFGHVHYFDFHLSSWIIRP